MNNNQSKNDFKIYRWTGWFGVAAFVIFIFALPLYYLAGPEPPIHDTIRNSGYIEKASFYILMRATLADPLIMSCFLVFLVGYFHLIRKTDSNYEWLSILVFGTGLVLISTELVADGLQGGAALDTAFNANPTIVRGLTEASFPFFGSIGLILSAFFLGSVGYTTLVTVTLPKWSGWFAIVAAVINLISAPSILGGTNYTGFYTATGYATLISQALLVIWFLVASISMIQKITKYVS